VSILTAVTRILTEVTEILTADIGQSPFLEKRTPKYNVSNNIINKYLSKVLYFGEVRFSFVGLTPKGIFRLNYKQ
jgi:hypothetical protein